MVYFKELEKFIRKKGRVNTFDVMEEFGLKYPTAWNNLKALYKFNCLDKSYEPEMRGNRPFLVCYYEFKKE